MAKIELDGFETYISQLTALKADSLKTCKAIVYPGAAILADAMRSEVAGLATITDTKAKNNYQHNNVNAHLSVSQKAGLVESLGITPIGRDRKGMIQCSVGFSGYNGVRTQKHPEGQPNAEVARSLEKGTSYLKRDAFATRAVKAARSAAEAAMQSEADTQIQRIMDANG